MDIIEVLLATPTNPLWSDMIFAAGNINQFEEQSFPTFLLPAELFYDNTHHV